jgi:hypothetical protein
VQGRRCVLHLREVEQLAPSRAAGRARAARTLAQLLTLLDGARARAGGAVAVVGTTHRPAALDAAMRRPGRLDRELAIAARPSPPPPRPSALPAPLRPARRPAPSPAAAPPPYPPSLGTAARPPAAGS